MKFQLSNVIHSINFRAHFSEFVFVCKHQGYFFYAIVVNMFGLNGWSLLDQGQKYAR